MKPQAHGAVIWDVDGTLVDTGELHFDAWVKLCQELGRDFTRDDFRATFGKTNPDIFDYLLDEPLDKEKLDQLADRKEALYRESAREQGVSLLPGVERLLKSLNEHKYLQAIGTSGPKPNVEMITELTQSRHYFQAFSTAENTQRGKPDPQVFQVAAERLKMEPARCLVMEDAVAGVEAAKAGGMKCIAVSFVGHHPEEKLRAAGADLVVKNLEEVTVEQIEKMLQG